MPTQMPRIFLPCRALSLVSRSTVPDPRSVRMVVSKAPDARQDGRSGGAQRGMVFVITQVGSSGA